MSDFYNRNTVPLWRVIIYAIFASAGVEALVIFFHWPIIARFLAPLLGVFAVVVVAIVGNASMLSDTSDA